MNKLILATAILFSMQSVAQNSSLNFDNSNTQYINIADNNSLDLSANFTIEGWLYPTGAGSSGTDGGIIVNKENSYEIARFPDGTLRYSLSANGLGTDWGWINTALVAPLNTWTHFAMVKSGTSISFYINGQAGYTGSAPATLTANLQDLRFANRSSAAHFYYGRMDEIRIWNTARTATQVKQYMINKNLSVAEAGLVAYYRMNEGAGTVTANSSTNTTGINGTLVSSPLWLASPVLFAANALSFDGTNDVVSIPDNNSLDISSAITIEAWVYAVKSTGVQNVACKSTSAVNTGYIFPRSDDGWATAVCYMHIAGSFRQVTVPYPSLNTWHHLAASYDGTTMKVYIDGALVGSLAIAGAISVNGNPVTIGNQTGFSEFFGGTVDELRIWNVARTQSQIQNDINRELDPATQSGLVSYYTFNQGIAAGDNTGLNTIIDQKSNNNGIASAFGLTAANSNYVAQKSSLEILPVHWLGFSAHRNSGTVILNWSTVNEQATDNYVVQYSKNGNSWQDLATVPGAGTGTGENRYSFTHATPVAGVNKYRIRQKDLDGAVAYSKTLTLLFSDQQKQLIVFPNPVSDGSLNVQLLKQARVSVYNNAGIIVSDLLLQVGAQVIDIRKWSKGVYYLKTGDEIARVVVQ